jgi:hypothetical protein
VGGLVAFRVDVVREQVLSGLIFSKNSSGRTAAVVSALLFGVSRLVS